jgi:hypothetical protein
MLRRRLPFVLLRSAVWQLFIPMMEEASIFIAMRTSDLTCVFLLNQRIAHLVGRDLQILLLTPDDVFVIVFSFYRAVFLFFKPSVLSAV